ncbi:MULTISPECIES: mechanosensitive ion channel family protein [Kitasatospora]|uniref:Putative small-conductance mechanosensitive channel n=1 Tax=Kitasatospora setae (strain ATCC 33774 / DSM 43861 / JCM 3304 / KCC A-0304 / NBRC 14216 / KM-6054) TaxID=452652 RepID=E4NID2_KITSK|nr:MULTISPECIES: mechanosensitive ion channel family protein [Kitasatospora]BAJ31262.1 putative small-conductance mechanosensitive channel [Kitasatospora setae KM-6054]
MLDDSAADSTVPTFTLPTSAADVTDTTRQAAGWLDDNWQGWLVSGLRIVLILGLALVLRAVVRKVIDKLVSRMARPADGGDDHGVLGGLLANSGVVNTERRQQRSEAIGSVLRSVASFSILGTASLMALSVLGVDLAPLLASAGVAGVAIGFGARNLVTDFLSGVFMIMEDQYGVGDEIDTGVATGTVLEVGLRVTKLRGATGEIWYIRNGEVKRIANMSQGWGTATVDVQIGYKEDLERVELLITEAAEQLAKESPYDELIWGRVKVLGVEAVAVDSVQLRIEARCTPGKSAQVARALRLRLKAAFDLAGVKLKEEAAATVPAQATAPEVLPPSALADPSSARSLAAKPIALP